MGEGLYWCPDDGEQLPGHARRRVRSPLAGGTSPARSAAARSRCGATPERVSNPQNAVRHVEAGRGNGRRQPRPPLRHPHGRPSLQHRPGPAAVGLQRLLGRLPHLLPHYLLGGAPTLYEDGGAIRDYVNIHDVVDANVLVLQDDGPPAGSSTSAAVSRTPRANSPTSSARSTVPPSRAWSPGSTASATPGTSSRTSTRCEGSAGHRVVRRRSRWRSTPRGWERCATSTEILAEAERKDARPRRGPAGRGVKAFLLAAGLGTRLRPLTDTTPKCMLTVDGRPMLDIWLDAFAGRRRRRGAGQPAPPARAWSSRTWPRATRPAVGPHGLRAGAARQRRDVAGQPRAGSRTRTFFLACNADNLTDFDLRSLIDAQTECGPIATMAVFHAASPSRVRSRGGRRRGTIVGFWRSRTNPPGDLANAGMYAFAPSVLDLIKTGARATSALTCCRGWWAGPGRCRSATGISSTSARCGALASQRGVAQRRAAMIITQTPLRIGLVGGGTDLPGYYREHGGRVLNAAIDKYIYVIVKQRFDDDIYVNYSKKEIVSPGRGPRARTRPRGHAHDRRAQRRRDHHAGRHPVVRLRPRIVVAVTVGLLHALFAYQGKSGHARRSSPNGRAPSRSTGAGSRSASRTSTSPRTAGSATSVSGRATTWWWTRIELPPGRSGGRCSSS